MQRNRRSRARGAVLVEYAFLLVVVAIPAVAGLIAGGALMYQNYMDAKSQILGPLP